MIYSSDDIKNIILKARCVISAFVNDDICLADNQGLYISICQLKKALELNVDIQDTDEYQSMVSALSAKLEAFAYLFDDITVDDSYYSIEGKWVYHNIINDNITSQETTWSSYKIQQELNALPIQPTGSNLKGEWIQEAADAGEYDKFIFVSHNSKIWKSLVDNNTAEPSESVPTLWEVQSEEDFAESILTEDVTSSVTEGNITAGETLPIGMTFTGFVKKFLQKIFYPTYVAPTFSLSQNAGSLREIGETVNVQLTFNFNRGQIKGKVESGIWNPEAFQDYRAGASVSYTLNGTTQSGNVLTVNNHVVTAGTNSFSGTVTYLTGPQPKDSNGADYQTGLAGGTSSVQSASFQGQYLTFFGVGTIVTNSNEVRTLLTGKFGKTFTLPFPPGATKASFAYPASWPDITNSSVKYVEGFNSDVGDTFTKSTFTVNDAGGNPVNYKIYTVEFPAPAAAQITYNVTLP